MSVTITLKSPLFTAWQEQYVRLRLRGVAVGAPLGLTIDGTSTPFQYTGEETEDGAEVLLPLGFEVGETKTLVFSGAEASNTDLHQVQMSLAAGATVGAAGRELLIPAPAPSEEGISGPFAGWAGFPWESSIHCEFGLLGATLARVNEGPLFNEYALDYRFESDRHYTLRVRCYTRDPYVEVEEQLALGMNARLAWTLNPELVFDQIISRDNFEAETQPTVEPLALERTRDVLCRLQMPVLSEYFIPNNRGWFAFCDSRDEGLGMLGVLGLYGARWREPVENIPELRGEQGRVVWHASLASGERHWLLYAGPVEKEYTAERRFIFHRLHAEFNALRLDEHLDLTGEEAYDAECWAEPGVFAGEDLQGDARQRAAALPCLTKLVEDPEQGRKQLGDLYLATFQCLLEPTPAQGEMVCAALRDRFERWVRQFQGWRTGEFDYSKNVIGFSRTLRGLLIAYELLRKAGLLTKAQWHELNAYFVFAARRMMDQGRWPHDRTWRHPDHPESIRDLYTYGGEHKPDRLVWTNSLPNFQSDPNCALAHLAALLREHPDAGAWRHQALGDIERQLTAYCGASGAWEESINYALYTLSYLIITMRPLKYRWGLDYFNDERVRRFVGWLCRFFGPYDRRFEAYTWPPIGNSVLPTLAGSLLLAYAGELAEDDPLRQDCLAIYQLQADGIRVSEHYGTVLAAMAPLPDRPYVLRPAASEVMDEVGVSMREKHMQADESYLFQKVGFAKDHYEGDETSFNWYAKGTPFLMDYGTYTGDVAGFAAHNLVEIPDEDALRRGYLAERLLSPVVDYTRCEAPVTLKLLWGRVRSFAEVDDLAATAREKTPYFYIGDHNPVGPKCWKVRLLLFVKPDYVALFDRVYGEVPHRYNLHFTGDDLRREGPTITGHGRFDLDLLAFVQHPEEFRMDTGELIPTCHAPATMEDRRKHRQAFLRLYNPTDGLYRTLLFARERGREVEVSSLGAHGMKVVTPEYTDYVFLHNEVQAVATPEVAFSGMSGWIRRRADGEILACVPEGEEIAAFGMRLTGRGPWTYNLNGSGAAVVSGPTPRRVTVSPFRSPA